MLKVTKYVLHDIVRNKILIAYTVFLFVLSCCMFYLDENPDKAVSSLLTIINIIVPLVSMIFTTSYFYNSYEFIELLVAQPLKRTNILLGEYIGIAGSLTVALIIGLGIPICMYALNPLALTLFYTGILLSLIFTSLAFLCSVATRDKAKGMGLSLLIWFFFSVIYDGLILGILYSFSDYPLEKTVLVLTAFNPIDLGRIIVMLQMDVSALMGYTGALYKTILGTNWGLFISVAILLVWFIVPLLICVKIFKKKNL
ncbi:ABC transporter permease [Solitalea sp. MAHUQ-68]|uniref:ABC transporter permease n=1 Tax=Solitalea agri TaxID=2953739 RepID=A0A9X2F3F6_9SPHI|nr:ABC transporter permease subunit [Solitalea agri]MCO4293952.1 ABC transporter permease [Solitalea agri]